MKKLFYLFVLIALLIPAAAFASGGKPPQPTCDEGLITVEESVWTDGHFVCPEGYEYIGMGYCKKGHDYQKGKYVPGAWSEPVCREPIPGCMDDAALNFNPDAEVDDDSCYYECDFTYEFEGLSSPGTWSEWEWDGEVYTRCREIKTAIQHRDKTTDKICEVESRSTEQCESRAPNGVSVGVSASCGKSVDGIVYQLQGGVGIDPAGGATLTLDGVEYTAGSPWWGGFGTHTWSAVATEGYVIVTESEGSFKIEESDCNDAPEVPPTGAELLVGPAIAGLAGIAMFGVGAYLLRKEREH